MLDKILAFVAAFLKKTTTTTTLTPEVGTGSIYVMQVGKIVLLTGQVATTTALSHGGYLVMDVPRPKISGAPFMVLDNNVGWTIASSQMYVSHYGTTSGALRVYGNHEERNRSLRFSVAYIAA